MLTLGTTVIPALATVIRPKTHELAWKYNPYKIWIEEKTKETWIKGFTTMYRPIFSPEILHERKSSHLNSKRYRMKPRASSEHNIILRKLKTTNQARYKSFIDTKIGNHDFT